MKKKLLILGTLTDEMNGSARSFARLCKLMNDPFSVVGVVPDNNGIASFLMNDIEEVEVVNHSPVRRSISNLFSIPISAYRLYKVILRHKPDVIHINDIPWFYVIGIAKLLKIPVTIHSRFYENNNLARGVISWFLCRSNAVIYVSDFNRSLWELDGKANNITLHNPGIFSINYNSVSDYQLPKKYLLVVARIGEEKGITEAICLFAKLYKVIAELSLVIVGDTLYQYQEEYKNECKALIKELELDSCVYWFGKIKNPHFLYKNSFAFVHLPRFEDPFPTTVMEALAIGCPIVVNRKGGIKEQVSGFEGVFMMHSENQVGELIEFLVNALPSYDRAELYSMKFGEASFKTKFADIINSVLNDN